MSSPTEGRIVAEHTCPQCQSRMTLEQWESAWRVCPACEHHSNLPARLRLESFLDPGWHLLCEEITSSDPLQFVDAQPYPERIANAAKDTGASEAVLVAEGALEARPVLALVMEFRFLGGSMGSAAGERVWRAFAYAAERRLPVIAFPSSGGARMQEGIISLMQMAKTATAVTRFQESRLPYIVVLTHPTFGGVSASFGALGDVTLAEPGALIGFSGPRVIEQVSGQKLPPGFQSAEFVQEHGFVDAIVRRGELRGEIAHVLNLLIP